MGTGRCPALSPAALGPLGRPAPRGGCCEQSLTRTDFMCPSLVTTRVFSLHLRWSSEAGTPLPVIGDSACVPRSPPPPRVPGHPGLRCLSLSWDQKGAVCGPSRGAHDPCRPMGLGQVASSPMSALVSGRSCVNGTGFVRPSAAQSGAPVLRDGSSGVPVTLVAEACGRAVWHPLWVGPCPCCCFSAGLVTSGGTRWMLPGGLGQKTDPV